MTYQHALTLLCITLLAVGCTWTAPNPTSTPWPSSTPGPTATPASTVTPETLKLEEEPVTVETNAPKMPTNPADRNQMFSSPPPMVIDRAQAYQATIKTSKGDILCELFADKAPQTVNNFIYLARAGFYDGLTFHRVVAGFVIQGGDPLSKGNGGPGYTIPAEIGMPHAKGALATARLSDQVNPARDSSGSQFYITLDKQPHLDGGYTVFGQVLDGMSVVERVAVGDLIQEIVVAEQ